MGGEERERFSWEELRVLEMTGSHVIMVLRNEGCWELGMLGVRERKTDMQINFLDLDFIENFKVF